MLSILWLGYVTVGFQKMLSVLVGYTKQSFRQTASVCKVPSVLIITSTHIFSYITTMLAYKFDQKLCLVLFVRVKYCMR